jgi:hypothetical protein
MEHVLKVKGFYGNGNLTLEISVPVEDVRLRNFDCMPMENVCHREGKDGHMKRVPWRNRDFAVQGKTQKYLRRWNPSGRSNLCCESDTDGPTWPSSCCR